MSARSWALAASPDARIDLSPLLHKVLAEFSVGATTPAEYGPLGQLQTLLAQRQPIQEIAAAVASLSLEGYLRGAVTVLAEALLLHPRAEVVILLCRELNDGLDPALGISLAKATLMLEEVAEKQLEQDGPYVAAHLLLGEQLERRREPHDAIRHYEAVLATDVENRRAMSGWSRCNRDLGAAGDLEIGRRVGLSMLEGIEAIENELGLGTDRYDLGRPLGRGRHAVVFQARDRRVGRDVAVKRLLSDRARRDGVEARLLEQRFFDEVRTLSRVRSPYVVALYDVQPRHRFVAMELCRGGSLRLALRRGLVGPDALDRLHPQLASALSAVHAADAVHRDVKPANILLRDTKGALPIALADFGLAITRSESAAAARAGTLRYLAPELRRAPDEPATPASDLFAAGVVLLEVALSPAPLPGSFDRIATEFDPASLVPPSVPDRWRDRLVSLLDADPSRRRW
ncbi:MAG: protein kinase domain-containing protein [Nannocystaceae bacterium]